MLIKLKEKLRKDAERLRPSLKEFQVEDTYMLPPLNNSNLSKTIQVRKTKKVRMSRYMKIKHLLRRGSICKQFEMQKSLEQNNSKVVLAMKQKSRNMSTYNSAAFDASAKQSTSDMTQYSFLRTMQGEYIESVLTISWFLSNRMNLICKIFTNDFAFIEKYRYHNRTPQNASNPISCLNPTQKVSFKF